MFVGLCAGDGDKYFFQLWESGNQQRTLNITIIISASTTENPSINHHHHLISTIIISITHHRGVYKVYSSPFIMMMPLQIYLLQHDILVDFLSSIGSGKQQSG